MLSVKNMFLQFVRRLPTSVSRFNKKNISTVSWSMNIFENSMKIVEQKMGSFRIFGPIADEVVKNVDLTNKTCLITGANSGIGLEMTRCLSSSDCNVLMLCRNTYAASVVAKGVCEKYNRLQFYETNLASLKSVNNCFNEILRDHKKIDIVILNAGVFGLPWTLTDDGLETTFQVNYLSQYYLLMNIEKMLASDARVVFVSSESHRNINWHISTVLTPCEEHLSLPKDQYTTIKAYNISKLCGILFMHYLGYCWLNTGKSVFCAHPGSFVRTRLCRNWWVFETLYAIMQPFSKSIKQAASTPIYCATSPELAGLSAQYYKDCERCAESDLAMDSHLSFRINDLTRDIIRNRIIEKDEVVERDVKSDDFEQSKITQNKETMDETLISNYSG